MDLQTDAMSDSKSAYVFFLKVLNPLSLPAGLKHPSSEAPERVQSVGRKGNLSDILTVWFAHSFLVMAGCKFFRPEAFRQCQKLANDFTVREVTEAWKRVEIVQIFAYLTYWRDLDDT